MSSLPLRCTHRLYWTGLDWTCVGSGTPACSSHRFWLRPENQWTCSSLSWCSVHISLWMETLAGGWRVHARMHWVLPTRESMMPLPCSASPRNFKGNPNAVAVRGNCLDATERDHRVSSTLLCFRSDAPVHHRPTSTSEVACAAEETGERRCSMYDELGRVLIIRDIGPVAYWAVFF